MSNLESRLQALEQQEAQLVMQLDEIRFLITGYKNTIKQAEEKTEEATEE